MSDDALRASAGGPERPRIPQRGSGALSLRVAVTRPLADDIAGEGEDRFMRLLRHAGFVPLPYRLLRVAPPLDSDPLRRAAVELADFAARSLHTHSRSTVSVWLVLTSRTALAPLLEALEAQGTGPGALRKAGVKVAAVGPATARALESAGLPANVVPDRFAGEDLLEALGRAIVQDARGPDDGPVRVILPRAEQAREVLPRGLREMGVAVEVAPAYRIVADAGEARRLAAAVMAGELDVITFTSGSAVRAFAAAWRTEVHGVGVGGRRLWPEGVQTAVIGRVTGQAVQNEGFEVDIQPSEATLEALARAIGDAGSGPVNTGDENDPEQTGGEIPP